MSDVSQAADARPSRAPRQKTPMPPTEEVLRDDPPASRLQNFMRDPVFSDCSLRLPRADGSEEEVPCHRVILAAASGHFQRLIMESDGARPVLELPTLPEDEVLRREVSFVELMPLALEFAYADQHWEAIQARVSRGQAMGLLVLGELLEMRSLSFAAFSLLEPGDAEVAACALYCAVHLGVRGKLLELIFNRSMEVLRKDFQPKCEAPRILALLRQLPLHLLVPMLDADDLGVQTEAAVLRLVQRVLRFRLSRVDVQLTLEEPRLGLEPPLHLPSCTWEVLVLEEPLPSMYDFVEPEVPKYSTASEVLPPDQLWKQLQLRVPVNAFRGDPGGCLLLRARGEHGYVLMAGLLPVERLPGGGGGNRGGNGGGRRGGGGNRGGGGGGGSGAGSCEEVVLFQKEGEGRTLHFKWRAEPAEPDPDTFSVKEAGLLLGTVRFAQLKHEELLAAMKDPILLEAGAQELVVTALSSRLAAYEQVEGGQPTRGPRPSTLKAALIASAQRPSAWPPTVAWPTLAADAAAGGARVRGGGQPLCPCSECQAGQLVLRARNLFVLVACSYCNHEVKLPRCVVAAAVDGHCAGCTVRLGAPVRTLALRVGREHWIPLAAKLPAGVDTLRGVCVAGCTDPVQLLEGRSGDS